MEGRFQAGNDRHTIAALTMLTKRIIPCLDCDRGRVVKGVKFFDHVDAGDPVEQAQRYQAAGRMNCVLRHYGQPRRPGDHGRPGPAGHGEDIHAPDGGRGIRTLEDATRLIQAGAEKVSVNSAAVQNPKLLAEIARKFGVRRFWGWMPIG